MLQIDKSIVKCWALGGCQENRLLRTECEDEVNNEVSPYRHKKISTYNWYCMQGANVTQCHFLLNVPALSDAWIGLVLFLVSLLLLSASLILIVRILSSALKVNGHTAMTMNRKPNFEAHLYFSSTQFLSFINKRRE